MSWFDSIQDTLDAAGVLAARADILNLDALAEQQEQEEKDVIYRSKIAEEVQYYDDSNTHDQDITRSPTRATKDPSVGLDFFGLSLSKDMGSTNESFSAHTTDDSHQVVGGHFSATVFSVNEALGSIDMGGNDHDGEYTSASVDTSLSALLTAADSNDKEDDDLDAADKLTANDPRFGEYRVDVEAGGVHTLLSLTEEGNITLQSQQKQNALINNPSTTLLGLFSTGTATTPASSKSYAKSTKETSYFDNDDNDDDDYINNIADDTQNKRRLVDLSDPILAQVQRNKQRNSSWLGGDEVTTSVTHGTPSKSTIGMQNLLASLKSAPLSPMYSGLEEPGEVAQTNVQLFTNDEQQQHDIKQQRSHQYIDVNSSYECCSGSSKLLTYSRMVLDCIVAVIATVMAIVQTVIMPLAAALNISPGTSTTSLLVGNDISDNDNYTDLKDYYIRFAWKIMTSKRGLLILSLCLLVFSWSAVVSEGSFLDVM